MSESLTTPAPDDDALRKMLADDPALEAAGVTFDDLRSARDQGMKLQDYVEKRLDGLGHEYLSEVRLFLG
ncbi:hypothetical protein ACRYCC_20445 [Actinomadura scrupuli]|uniref:hypothetical protein n=1 Tax=Actinomadura scrupuli TaxID=559629 RepID=UPI003D986838